MRRGLSDAGYRLERWDLRPTGVLYALSVLSCNIVDSPEKTVGNRLVVASEREAHEWQRSVANMMRHRGACHRGVFRFSTFEEAQSWMMNQVVQSALEYRRMRTSRE
ncbi:MAG TPA: hypothetical protein VGJ84_11065 [Polyangiaceae bacterium]